MEARHGASAFCNRLQEQSCLDSKNDNEMATIDEDDNHQEHLAQRIVQADWWASAAETLRRCTLHGLVRRMRGNYEKGMGTPHANERRKAVGPSAARTTEVKAPLPPVGLGQPRPPAKRQEVDTSRGIFVRLMRGIWRTLQILCSIDGGAVASSGSWAAMALISCTSTV